jgi:hypothetical protein
MLNVLEHSRSPFSHARHKHARCCMGIYSSNQVSSKPSRPETAEFLAISRRHSFSTTIIIIITILYQRPPSKRSAEPDRPSDGGDNHHLKISSMRRPICMFVHNSCRPVTRNVSWCMNSALGTRCLETVSTTRPTESTYVGPVWPKKLSGLFGCAHTAV